MDHQLLSNIATKLQQATKQSLVEKKREREEV
jgi:hypothetical protein